MSFILRRIRITDETGTNYTDLFADLDLDSFELLPGGAGPRGVDAMVPNAPHSRRANADGPLGAVIVRWIQSRIDTPADRYAWQYLDAADIHTIAFLDDTSGELEFINIFGHVENGRRGYRLRAIADALGLLIEHDLH